MLNSREQFHGLSPSRADCHRPRSRSVSSSPTAAPDFSDWSAPVNLGPVVNSTFAEGGPAISKDGLSLYFHSERPGGEGSTDIWVSQRASEDAAVGRSDAPRRGRQHPWSSRLSPPCPATSTGCSSPAIGSGGLGNMDIWVVVPRARSRPLRLATRGECRCRASIRLFVESAPSYFENDGGAPQLFFHSARPGGLGGTDIYVSELFPNGTFGPASLVAELSSPSNEQHPSIRFDGLEMFFFSDQARLAGRTRLVGGHAPDGLRCLVHADEPGADREQRPR